MNNFFERLKDILYDSIDYIIMLAIIVGVVFVIGWRLDVLFAKDNLDNEPKDQIIVETPKDPIEEPKEDDILEENLDTEGEILDNEEDKPEDNLEKAPKEEEITIVTINIPEGSLPSKIGSILESNGLVSSKNDFVIKAQEMNLDRSLRSGKYEIKKNSSLEEIVKIIARR